MKSLTDQLACARRELALRQRNYPKWVGDGKLTGDKARHETDCMTAIVATLEKAVLLEEVSNEMKAESDARERLEHRQQFNGQAAEVVL